MLVVIDAGAGRGRRRWLFFWLARKNALKLTSGLAGLEERRAEMAPKDMHEADKEMHRQVEETQLEMFIHK